MASAPEPAAASPPPAAPTPPGGGGGNLFNLARGAKGVALLLFLIPWVTVSCGGQELASMSGLDLATGSVSVANPMGGPAPVPTGSGGRGADLWVIAAAALIAGGLALTFVLGRVISGLIAAAASAAAAGLIGYTVLARIPAEVREQPMAASASGGAGGSPTDMGMNAQQMADMIKVEPTTGFWLLMAVLIAAVALNVMARSRAGP